MAEFTEIKTNRSRIFLPSTQCPRCYKFRSYLNGSECYACDPSNPKVKDVERELEKFGHLTSAKKYQEFFVEMGAAVLRNGNFYVKLETDNKYNYEELEDLVSAVYALRSRRNRAKEIEVEAIDNLVEKIKMIEEEVKTPETEEDTGEDTDEE